jgi:SNF2 family DNA or RNA helicase
LRFNRYDAGVVHDLAGDGVNWTSADALRSLAAALHDPAHADYRPPEALQAQLRPYQRAGAGWLQALHSAGLGGILADDMGLGKTMQAIAHLLQTGKRPSLIVAPTSVLPNWQAELARFAPHLSCHLWHGHNRRDGAGAMAEADVILTSYPLLSRDKDILTAQEWAVTVLDEAHVSKPGHSRVQGRRSLARGSNDCAYRHAAGKPPQRHLGAGNTDQSGSARQL